jgi:hypothetical protein
MWKYCGVRPFYRYYFSKLTAKFVQYKEINTSAQKEQELILSVRKILSNMDWSVLNSLPTIEEQLNHFNDTYL